MLMGVSGKKIKTGILHKQSPVATADAESWGGGLHSAVSSTTWRSTSTVTSYSPFLQTTALAQEPLSLWQCLVMLWAKETL